MPGVRPGRPPIALSPRLPVARKVLRSCRFAGVFAAGALILGRRHLDCVLNVYVKHYNSARPHRALELRCLDPPRRRCRSHDAESQTSVEPDRLGGLLHEYALDA
jgi:hypothetical protein